MKKFLMTLALMGALTAFPAQAHALIFNISQITSDSLWDGVPDISGNNIIWQSYDGTDYEVKTYDGDTIRTFTNNDYDDTNVDVGGSLYAWIGNNSIFANDGTSTTTLKSNVFALPQASQGNIFWTENFYQIFHYNGATTYQLPVTPDNGGFVPRIYANTVVWGANDGEVYYYDGTNITNLSNDPINLDGAPYIYGNKVVWVKSGPGPDQARDIFLYDGDTNTITNLTNTPSIPKLYPQVSENIVVWQQNNQLVYYNLLTDEISTTDILDKYFLSGNYVAGYRYQGLWQEDLMLFDGHTLYTLADGSSVGAIQGFDIDHNKIVWDFVPDDGASREIFLTEVQRSAVPEPATMVLLGSGLIGGAFIRRKRA